jgi:hypothetical protein
MKPLSLTLIVLTTAFAYNPPVDTAGPITARLMEPSIGSYGAGGLMKITQTGVAAPVEVVITNSAAREISGTVRLAVIDTWTVEPAAPQPFRVAANGRTRVEFRATPGAGTYNAHYPFHAYVDFEHEGRKLTAHPIMILETAFPDPPRTAPQWDWKPVPVGGEGAVGLWRLPVKREFARVVRSAALGASQQESAPVMPVVQVVRDGIEMRLGERLPSRGEVVEQAAVEFPLALPKATPLAFEYSGAPRTGYLGAAKVRVKCRPFAGGEEKTLAESAAAGAQSRVDLSAWAGQQVVLRIEGDSGSGALFIAQPTLIAGPPRKEQHGAWRAIGDFSRIALGSRGIMDAEVEVGGASFRGFRAQVLGDRLDDARSSSVLLSVTEEKAGTRLRVRNRYRTWAGDFDLVSEAWPEGPALLFRFWLENTPPPRPWLAIYIEELTAGPWREQPKRIYAGPGNVMENPRELRLGFGGHQLATSFIGLEWANGTALVQAVDVSPNRLDISRESRIASLNTAHAQTMSFIPARDVWAAAKAWRETNGMSASAGAPKLAGRFVFDLWGFGKKYGPAARDLERAFRYGLTNSAVVWHSWQRWGYDYRLPDIYPPNPEGGTFEEFKQLIETCRKAGVYFAPHDNYIDYYPDHDGFSYDNIVFRQDGTPYRAWFHRAREAQSYRARADRISPFLERNLRLIRDGLNPTSYFIDVWASMGPYDYWTKEGKFVDRGFTRKAWGESFAWIRGFLGNDAPQISEAGHDQLIGWLDGVQTQHLRVDKEGSGFVWRVACDDAERVPWFDMAHHDRIIQHGAGYPGRYEAGLGAREHGIYSDDYISTEVLTGHPVMVADAFSRDVVRKYWLTDPLMRNLAMQQIEAVEFAGGDMHRQKVIWGNGTAVWVNRGAAEWIVEGRALPQYGFYARSADGKLEAAIERGVEWSRSADAWYRNERGGDGFRITRGGGEVVLVPLPDSGTFNARIDWPGLAVKEAVAISEDGRELGRQAAGAAGVRCEKGVFAYRLR